MKFSHSERTLHDSNYTPPCNYYQNTDNESKIKTGSLLGPTLGKEQPNFGLSARFGTNNQKKAPGPGTYFSDKAKDQVKTSVKTGVVIRQYKKHGFLGGEERSPSIPYAQFKLDEEDEEFIREIQMNEDLNRSALSLKRKTDGYTFSKSPRHFQKAKDSAKAEENSPLQAIAQYNERRKRLQDRPIVNIKAQLQKNNERRAQIISMMNPEFIPSLELIQLIAKRRTKFAPGPGFYNQYQDEQNAAETAGVTFPVSRRFAEDKSSSLGPGKYKVQEEKKKSISISKSNRNLFNQKNQTDLEHRFYIDPFSNVKKRQNIISRAQQSPFSFGSQVARFTKVEKQPAKETHIDGRAKKQAKIEAVVEKRLNKLKMSEKRSTKESQGLLNISTMASMID